MPILPTSCQATFQSETYFAHLRTCSNDTKKLLLLEHVLQVDLDLDLYFDFGIGTMPHMDVFLSCFKR